MDEIAGDDDLREHIAKLVSSLHGLDIETISEWAWELAERLGGGRRLLAAGNGGSAALAQHLTAELVGRFECDRAPFSAISLHAETSSVTAIANDYGYGEVFARQVEAHGRAGDILVVFSTSGTSTNVVRALDAARERGMATWALTGDPFSPVASRAQRHLTTLGPTSATIQESQQVVVHLLVATMERKLAAGPARPTSLDLAARNAASTTSDPEPQDLPPSPIPPVPKGRTTRSHIVVVGDTLLDRDYDGQVTRISPEAPVPVVSNIGAVARPGGAGLAAVLAARAGNQVTLLTALSDDESGRLLQTMLAAAGVKVLDLGLEGPTPVKGRVRASGRTLLMLDLVAASGVSGRELAAGAAEAVMSADALVVSDYGCGVAENPLIRTLLAAAAIKIPLVWNPHPRGPAPVMGTRLVTPNRREASLFAGARGRSDALTDVINAAETLLALWDVAHVAVTRGAAGAVLVTRTGPPLIVAAPQRSLEDSCGAGDRFAVAAASHMGQGLLPSEAVSAAVHAASAYVAAGGPKNAAESSQGPSLAGADAYETVRLVREAGGTVVATGGCFDLLHTGHIHLLQEARRLGDCLIVCMNSDDSVANLKGEGRPVVSSDDRREMLLAIGAVDDVVIFDESTPEVILSKLRPDLFVKGGDYSLDQLPETAILRSWGGRVVTVPYMQGRSTTALVQAMQNSRQP